MAADRDPRSLAFLVTGDADGHPLQASTLYYFRLRARNSYDVSRWSAPVAIRPTGEAPGPPHSIVAMCHAGAAPVACSAGITADAQIEATWNPPVDDGGSAVTGYTLMYGEFGLVMADEAGARGSSMRNLQVATRSTSPITSFVITGLTNDIQRGQRVWWCRVPPRSLGLWHHLAGGCGLPGYRSQDSRLSSSHAQSHRLNNWCL